LRFKWVCGIFYEMPEVGIAAAAIFQPASFPPKSRPS